MNSIARLTQRALGHLRRKPGADGQLAATAPFAPRFRRPAQSIDVADLLGRPPVNLDTPELQRFLAGKRIMVTGAGGSIGSEICRQAMKFCPQRMVLVEQAENALFEIDRELRETWVGADIRPCIADICDESRVRQVFDAERPHVVFHAAAHKHVPMMEHNAGEAIKNNVFGTKTVADAAIEAGVSAFVMVSTDKAVNPSSVMGATKRFAELYIQSLNSCQSEESCQLSDFGELSRAVVSCQSIQPNNSSITGQRPRATRFVAVRFGNVLGSSGSVVPIFQKQIEAGGPVRVTHRDMKRFFMTIPEASQLVMQAGAVAQGGEIFVLDMGQPIRIMDLARELIRRNGLVPDEDIPIHFSGIRPGEKLYEELSCDNEQTRPTAHPKISVWKMPAPEPKQVKKGLEILLKATQGTISDAVAALARCVPEYRPGGKIFPSESTEEKDVRPMRLIPPDVEAA